jgi:hypothetical protein
MSDPSMRLPAGKTCGDCVNFAYCLRLFQCKYASETCDWAPARFREKKPC